MKQIIDNHNFNTPTDEELDRYIIDMIKILFEHSKINAIVQERVLLGQLHPGETIPQEFFDQFAPTMCLLNSDPEGEWISNDKCVANRNFSEFATDFFMYQVSNFFHENYLPKQYFDEDSNYIGKFKDDILEFYPIFETILTERISFSTVGRDITSEKDLSNEKLISKFLYTYFSGRAKTGSIVNYYCSQMNPMPQEIANLVVRTAKGYRYLDTRINTLNFQTAFLSQFKFLDDDCRSLYAHKLSALRERQI